MGSNVANPSGDTLGDGEEVLRGLNPKHCEEGMPTEGCFILKPTDRYGPSHGILSPSDENARFAPMGARQGISPAIFETLLPKSEHGDYGIAQLNVGRALEHVRRDGVIYAQDNDESWGEYQRAHAMIMGYQTLRPQTRRDLQRHLAKIASEAVLKRAIHR